MTVILFLSFLFTSPLIVKYVKGWKKLLIFLQQIIVLVYLAIVTIQYGLVLDPWSRLFTLKSSSMQIDLDRTHSILIWESILSYMTNCFYFKIYIYCLMQSLDIYKLICSPFEYADFSNTRNFMKCLFIACCVSCLAAIDHVAVINLYFSSEPAKIIEELKSHQSILHSLRLFTIFKLALIKTLLLVANLKLVVAIRKSLNESVDISGRKKQSSKRLLFFSLLPLCFNILFSIHELLAIVFSFKTYDGKEAFVSDEVIMNLTIVVLTLQPLSYLAAYFYLFPGLRKVAQCQKQK